MLVLSRKANERIIIGGNIAITVIEVQGQQVRLGIEAPKTISVYREELLKTDKVKTCPPEIK